MNISRPRGTYDVLPDESYRWQCLEERLRSTADSFGFDEIRFPMFEHTELFLRGIGDTTDVVQKEMYTFEDKGGRSITLRPEGTASVVRAFVENGLHTLPMPFKCYYIAPNFRYENPQKGRLRQHTQFGAELFGSASPIADAELISLASCFLRAIGINGAELRLNSIGCPECRAEYLVKLLAYLRLQKDGLCENCLNRVERNPMRALDCKNEKCKTIASSAPLITDNLCASCGKHFFDLKEHLNLLDIGYTLDPMIVRGLDYYTRTVFEFTVDCIGSQSTICAGGRYDGLVEQLGGKPIPALGFGSGLERLLLTLEAQNFNIPLSNNCKLYIASIDDDCRKTAIRLALQLREKGIRVEHDILGRGIKAQMKYADKIRAEYVLVIGGDEIVSGTAKLQNMNNGTVVQVALDAGSMVTQLQANNYHK